jgi:hypothetical protein
MSEKFYIVSEGETLNVDFIKDLRDLADECDFALSELLETFGDIGEA